MSTNEVGFSHAVRMLEEYWPQLGAKELDRFLIRYFREKLKAAGKNDRLRYSSLLFSAFRHFVAIARTFGADGTRADCIEKVRAAGAEKFLRAYQAFGEVCNDPGQLFAEDMALFAARADRSGWSGEDQAQFLRHMRMQSPLWVRIPGEGPRLLADRSAQARADLPPGSQMQDWASQAIGQAVGARSGQKVWDMCAGSGGKTLQLVDGLLGRGLVVATDIRSHALARLKERASRDQLSLIMFCEDEVPEGMFDAVLVDAPCSGSGTWRRHPDQMLAVSAERISELTRLQGELLNRAAGSVKQGGRLVYATCSWYLSENEDVVEKFLLTSAGRQFFERKKEMVGSPAQDSDTMFVAVLERL